MTLTGPSGGGKTRVGGEIAARQQSRFLDGITVVDLAFLAAPAMVGPEVMVELNVRQLRGMSVAS